jgi:peptide/nickel transport system substrate-binding protein
MLRRVSALLTATTVLAAATACSNSGSASSSAGSAFDPKSCQGGTLYILDQTSATDEHFDPAQIYTSGGGAVPSLVFRTLTTRKRVPGQAGTTVALTWPRTPGRRATTRRPGPITSATA